MAKTDTGEKGFERLICTALTGPPCGPPSSGAVGEPIPAYGGSGWIGGSPEDYDRQYCVDLAHLRAFLLATQPKVAVALDLDNDSPAREDPAGRP
jgi:type I restriction enzyme R subunit